MTSSEQRERGAIPDKPRAATLDTDIASLLDDAMAAAIAVRGAYPAWIRLAGHDVKLVFAGEDLRSQMTRAFAHIAIAEAEASPELEIFAWDHVQSGVAIPPALMHLFQPEETKYGEARQIGTLSILFDVFDQSLSVLDRRRNRGYYWLPDARYLAESYRAAPVRSILGWWLQERGFCSIHAGAIGTEHGGLLLCGRSGVGKSTTCVSCAEAGFEFVSDDYCILEDGPEVRAYGLSSAGKVFPHRLADLPAFASLATNEDDPRIDKVISFLAEDARFRVLASKPISGLIILAGKGKEAPALRRITPAVALLHLAPSSLVGFPGGGQSNFSGLRRIVTRVPCFEMQLAAHLPANAVALRGLLASLAEAPG